MKSITACIDGSAISGSICDAAAWASTTLDAPIKFLHVLEKTHTPAREDLSGNIGLGSREHLLDELVALDEKRGKLALEHGKHLLEDARLKAEKRGISEITLLQRHGSLLEACTEFEAETRLFVLGRLGEDHDIQSQAIGAQLENIVRAIHTPILVTVGEFINPTNFMIAYDGSETANNSITRISKSPLLRSMPGHIVMVGAQSPENIQQLEQATKILTQSGHKVESHLIQGNIIETLAQFQKTHHISLKVMGAYGHSRIREFFIGSNTSKMIGSSLVPLLLLR